MILSKFTPCQDIQIWAPRYKDRVVLIAVYKLGAHNKITFTKAPHMGTDPYYISGKKVQTFPIDSNGRVKCYAVPVDELEKLEFSENLSMEV